MIPQDRMIKHMYQTQLSSFFRFAFGLLHPGREYRHRWLVDVLGEYLDRCFHGEITRLIINMPPRYLKTMCVSVAFPAWVLAHRPESKFMCIAGNLGLVEAHDAWSRDLITHPRYRALFPHVRLTNTRHGLRLRHGGSRTGFMPTKSITGRGADYIIIDDPLPAGAGDDPNLCKNINDWYDQNIYQRLNDKAGGSIIVVMQRLHVDDLTGHLLRQGGWHVLTLPAIADEDAEYPLPNGGSIIRPKGQALHPDLENRAQLRDVMLRIGAKPFMAQYQQKPYPLGEGDGRHGCYSSLREGIPWTPDQGPPKMWFGHVPEESILLHTVFGEGEHPWPDDMRNHMTMKEWIMCYGHESDKEELKKNPDAFKG